METVGLRPGEKLHEHLFYDAEEVEPTVNAKVLRALAPPPSWDVREEVERLIAMATGEDEGALRLALLGYVSESDEAAPASERADATRWGDLAAIDAAQSQFGGASGTAAN